MAKSLDAWIHNFTVTDCETHKKGYTVYKITSIIFPVFVPESLTCLTVWKRYNDVKKLRKQIVRRHKELRLTAPAVPPLTDDGYFRRFDEAVIAARKQHILHFLDYIAQHPGLYKCHAFVQFFEASQSPASHSLARRNSNIASICGEIEVPLVGIDGYQLIDPYRDEQLLVAAANGSEKQSPTAAASAAMSCSLASSSTLSSETTSACSEAEDASLSSPTHQQPANNVYDDVDEVDCAVEAFDDACYEEDEHSPPAGATEWPAGPATVTVDYIFEAALEFSEAVRAEVARNYRHAFELYKSGIGKLMRGVRGDASAERRRVAKDKISKYMLRAEQIHACHLMGAEVRLESSSVMGANDRGSQSLALRCNRLVAYEELSRIRVLKVLHGVMQVQDMVDQQIYMMKAIEKPANFSVQLLEHERPVVGMVKLYSYFVSETTVYLLLQQASGGRLWDYIRNYRETAIGTSASIDAEANDSSRTLDSLFLEPMQAVQESTTDPDDIDDDAFLGTLKRLRSPVVSKAMSSNEHGPHGLDETLEWMEKEAPAFEMLTSAMEVAELLNCSQKLLESVNSTLQRSNSEVAANPVERIFLSQDAQLASCARSTQSAAACRSPTGRRNTLVPGAVNPPRPRASSGPRVPQRSIIRWASELCRGIGDLHANGIQCYDLNAGNLLLGPGGQLLLSYFHRTGGAVISRVAAEDLYVAPDRPLTLKSDWWSFGVLLFELLTGERFVHCHPGGLAAYFEIQYPEGAALSADAIDLLDGTLQTDAALRLDEAAIRAHRFFQDIDWGVAD